MEGRFVNLISIRDMSSQNNGGSLTSYEDNRQIAREEYNHIELK